MTDFSPSTLWQIFWRTFAQLAAASLLAAEGFDWVDGHIGVNLSVLGFGLLAAFIGAVIAVAHAFATSPAGTALQKALRSAAQQFAGGLSVIVINDIADVVRLKALLPTMAIAVVLAFGITYFQYQASPVAKTKVM